MRLGLFGIILLVVLLLSCEKEDNTCNEAATLQASNITPTIGETVEIVFEGMPSSGLYQWSTPKIHRPGTSNKLVLSDIQLSDKGLYICHASENGCSVSSTVYIDVQLKQENPPCTLTNNQISGAGIPQTVVNWTSKRFHPSYNALVLEATGNYGQPPYLVVFNSYNGNNEPSDGTYITNDAFSFSPLDELNLISVSFVHASNFYHAVKGQKVYVKHVGGKLRVSFCDLNVASPPYPAAKITGQITEL